MCYNRIYSVKGRIYPVKGTRDVLFCTFVFMLRPKWNNGQCSRIQSSKNEHILV